MYECLLFSCRNVGTSQQIIIWCRLRRVDTTRDLHGIAQIFQDRNNYKSALKNISLIFYFNNITFCTAVRPFADRVTK